MQELINSFVRLSAAMTVYSMQQMQSAVETIDPNQSVTKIRQMLDSMTNALTAQVDESKRATVESMSNLGTDVVGRTFETLNVVSALNPQDFIRNTNEMVKKTSDSIAGMMRPSTNSAGGLQADEDAPATHSVS